MAHLGAIEIAVRAIGPQRVLLGTGSPLRAIQSSLNAIAVTEVGEGDRARDSEPTHVLVVHGADHQGIVHAFAKVFADREGLLEAGERLMRTTQ